MREDGKNCFLTGGSSITCRTPSALLSFKNGNKKHLELLHERPFFLQKKYLFHRNDGINVRNVYEKKEKEISSSTM